MMERRSDGVSGNGRNGGNVGGRFGRDGMRFGWDLMAKGVVKSSAGPRRDE